MKWDQFSPLSLFASKDPSPHKVEVTRRDLTPGVTRRIVLLGAALAAAAVLLPARIWRHRRREGRGGHKARFFRRLTVIVMAGGLGSAIVHGTSPAASVQQPVVSGSFYPAEPSKLREMVRGFIKDAGKQRVKGEIAALISPHAGYVFSGPVAGAAYNELRGRSYDLVVVLAPSHTAPLNGVSALDMDAYRTPLGEVRIDREAVGALTTRAPWIRHVPALFAREHSLEVQLPFLQEVFGDRLRILPLVLGTPSRDMASALADVLSDTLRGRKTLFVASSDMSHYHGYGEATRMDRGTLDMIAAGDLERLFASCDEKKSELCGEGPVRTVALLAEKMGIEKGTVLRYANSGDTAGDKSRVVGYGAVAYVNPPEALSLADKAALLALARDTVETYVREGRKPEATEESPALTADGAAFVTLKLAGQLRGCIGQLKSVGPLNRSVQEMAVAACSQDRRFAPVKAEELSRIRVEVSVLSPFIPVEKTKEIVVGRDGLFLTARGRSGVLLPQVPGEQGWDREEFLKQICQKAGLPAEAINDKDAKLYRFTAQVFRE